MQAFPKDEHVTSPVLVQSLQMNLLRCANSTLSADRHRVGLLCFGTRLRILTVWRALFSAMHRPSTQSSGTVFGHPTRARDRLGGRYPRGRFCLCRKESCCHFQLSRLPFLRFRIFCLRRGAAVVCCTVSAALFFPSFSVAQTVCKSTETPFTEAARTAEADFDPAEQQPSRRFLQQYRVGNGHACVHCRRKREQARCLDSV